jgi:hypothetical protein
MEGRVLFPKACIVLPNLEEIAAAASQIVDDGI